MHLSTYTKAAHNQINLTAPTWKKKKKTFLWDRIAQVSRIVWTKLSKNSPFTNFSFSLTWSGKLQWKDTTENTAGRLSPLVSGETAEWCHRNRKDGSEKCFCKTAAERPLSASDYKFIFCKGTFWHNVQRKDIKCNLSANETKKWMRRRERQHILLKYVDMPLRSQCVPPSDTKGWNVLISADNIYTEKASNTSFKVPKTSIALSPEGRGLGESPLQLWQAGNRACAPSHQHHLFPS